MPTFKPRYIVTLEKKEAAVLERYAASLGMRPSRVIKMLIEQGMGHIEGSIEMLERLASIQAVATEDASKRANDGVIGALQSITQEGEAFLTSVREIDLDSVFQEGTEEESTLPINKGNKGNKGVRLNEKLSESKKPYLFAAVDNTKKDE